MKGVQQSLRVCSYQLRILSRNYKIYTLVVCMWIFMWNDMELLRGFIDLVQEKASPFLFPFLFTDRFLTALIFTGALLFFIEAPFYNKEQLFVVMRSSLSRWSMGQVIYVGAVSVLYMCFLIVLSIVVLFPHLSFSGDWGKIWTTLAMTDVASQTGMSVVAPKNVLYAYTPVQAVLLVFVLGSLICSFYGFAAWCLNLYVGKMVSLVLILASVFLVTRVQYLPYWMMYLVPSAWGNLGVLSEYALHGLSVSRVLLILILGNIGLGGLAVWKTTHGDLAK